VDFENPDLDKFPRFGNVTAYTITLSPGDVLYLPPFWYHRVIAEDVSISVSMWSSSEEALFYYEKILTIPLPFETHWTREQNIGALHSFIRDLVTNLHSGDFVRSFLIEQRYVPVFGRLASSHVMNCHPENSLNFQQFVGEFAKSFAEMGNYANEKEDGNTIRNVYLANYVEHIIKQTLGVQYVNVFLQSCF